MDGHARRQLWTDDRPAGKVLGERDPLVNVDADVLCSQPRGEVFQDRPDALIHAEAEDLNRQDVVVAIDDQARQAVPFGVNHAIGVGGGIELEHIFRKAIARSILSIQNAEPGGSRKSGAIKRRAICERLFHSP